MYFIMLSTGTHFYANKPYYSNVCVCVYDITKFSACSNPQTNYIEEPLELNIEIKH